MMRVVRLVGLAIYFLYELVLSSVRVAWDVITPRQRSTPGIVAVPLDVRSAVEITTLANLISLTPGSLSLEVTDDRRLYVHIMFIDDPEDERRAIKEGFERRVKEALG